MDFVVETGAHAGRRFRLDPGQRITVGRDPAADLHLDDRRVSRRHAQFRADASGGLWFDDLGSTNGSFVDGQVVTGSIRLRGGERVMLGDVVIAVPAMPDAGPPQPAPIAPPGPATIERAALRVAVNRANRVAIAAVAIAVLAVAVGGGYLLVGRGDTPRDRSAVIDELRPSVLQVIAHYADGTGSGTGWVYDAGEGLVVTNHHVIDGSGFVEVRGETRELTAAEIVASAPCEDLALLRLADRDGLAAIELGSQSELRQGQDVLALGYPANAGAGSDFVATDGIVSVVRTTWADPEAVDVPNYSNVVQTDAAINPGNSGGPLVTFDAELVGVNSAGITDIHGRTIQGQGYAIGVDRVKEIVGQLREGRSLLWTGMGLEYPFSAEQLTRLDLPARRGLIVRNVVPGTPAADAGFGVRPALVVAVNGIEMDGRLPSYCRAAEDGPDDAVTVLAIDAGADAPREVRVPFR